MSNLNRTAGRDKHTDGGNGGLAAAGPATPGEGREPAICPAPKCGQPIEPGQAVIVQFVGWWLGLTADGGGQIASVVEIPTHIGCSDRLTPAALRAARQRVRVCKEGSAPVAEPEEART